MQAKWHGLKYAYISSNGSNLVYQLYSEEGIKYVGNFKVVERFESRRTVGKYFVKAHKQNAY